MQLRISLPLSPVGPTTTSRTRRKGLYLLLGFFLLFAATVLVLPKHNQDVSDFIASGKDKLTEWHGEGWNLWPGYESEHVGEAGWAETGEKIDFGLSAPADDSSDSGPEDWLTHGNESRCAGWDPEGDEKDDPAGCLRARQYRQTLRVIRREEAAKHDRWEFTRKHNLVTLRNLLSCFLPLNNASYTECPPRPLIISGWWYTACAINGATTGEVIWQSGVLSAIEDLGITWIAVGPYRNWIEVAEMMPDVYRVLWNSDSDTVACVTDPRCVAKDHYVPPENGEDLSLGVPDEERGVIPIWMLNVVDYWGSQPLEIAHTNYWWNHTEHGDWSYHPLGAQWIATPWPLPNGHAHLPYSIEDHCMKLPTIPHSERNDSVLMFAKRSAYFDYNYVSPRYFWTNLTHDPSFNLLSTVTEEDGHPLPDGLVSIGKQTRDDYERLVGSVKALLGMGAPQISPSVYTALCQGTPVIVPYFREDVRMDGWRLYSGHMQHGPAATIGEPYVYSYYAQNYTQLVEVIHRALDTPIERYIPPDMRYEHVKAAADVYLKRDLRRMFERVVEGNGGVPRMSANASERCRELKRCGEFIEAGRKPSAPVTNAVDWGATG